MRFRRAALKEIASGTSEGGGPNMARWMRSVCMALAMTKEVAGMLDSVKGEIVMRDAIACLFDYFIFWR